MNKVKIITAHSYTSVTDLCDNDLVAGCIIYICFSCSKSELEFLEKKIHYKNGVGFEISKHVNKNK